MNSIINKTGSKKISWRPGSLWFPW